VATGQILILRIAVGAVGLVILAMLGTRRRAATSPDVVPVAADRHVPDVLVEVMRNLLVGPAAVGVIVWLAFPDAMAWSALGMPAWARWSGVALLAVTVAGIGWAFAALGRNFATTLVVKPGHELVITGPYRYVRHPMYTLGAMLFIGLMLVAARWFIGALGVAGMVVLMVLRVPKEEAMLAGEFGDSWAAYVRRTGRDRHVFGERAMIMLAEAHEKASAERTDFKAALAACIERLPDKNRKIVELRYQRELGFEEIAERLRTTVNAATVALHRVRRALMECIRQQAAGGAA